MKSSGMVLFENAQSGLISQKEEQKAPLEAQIASIRTQMSLLLSVDEPTSI